MVIMGRNKVGGSKMRRHLIGLDVQLYYRHDRKY